MEAYDVSSDFCKKFLPEGFKANARLEHCQPCFKTSTSAESAEPSKSGIR